MPKSIPVLMPAANASDICHTCQRRADQPYRTRDAATGKDTGGCVANFHTGHLLMRDAFWHNRPEAKRIRAATAKFYA